MAVVFFFFGLGFAAAAVGLAFAAAAVGHAVAAAVGLAVAPERNAPHESTAHQTRQDR